MASGSTPECSDTTDDQLCPYHNNMHLEMYCETCERAVCSDCFYKETEEKNGPETRPAPVCYLDHKWTSKAGYTELIRKREFEIKESCKLLTGLYESCDKQVDAVDENAEKLKGQVDEYLNRLRNEHFDSSRQILLDLVTGMTENRKALLTDRKRIVEKHEEKLRKAKAFLENQPSEKSASFYKKLVKDTNDAIDDTQKLLSLPHELQVDLAFRSSFAEDIISEFKMKLEQLVCLPIPKFACPSDVRTTGSGARVAVVGEQAVFEIMFIAAQNPSEMPYVIADRDNVTCTLEPMIDGEPIIDGDPINCNCIREADDRYSVYYTVKQTGDYSVKFLIGSRRVSIFPQKITAINCYYQQLHQLGSATVCIDQVKKLHKPLGLAVAADGTMVIVEGSANQVTIKRKKGIPRKSFGRRGTAAGHFVEPCDVALVDDTHILVTDTGNHRIQKFTLAGQQFVAQVGEDKIQPTAIAIDCKQKRVFTLDKRENCVQALSFDLQFLHISIHCPDDAPLTCVGVDSVEGMIYVGCKEHYIHKYDQARLQKCDQARQPLINFNHHHVDLHQPSCLCVSQLGLVFVGDAESNSILMFDSAGKCLQRFDNLSADHPELPPVFGYPSGLAVDASNSLYYSDNDRLYVIRLMELLL